LRIPPASAETGFAGLTLVVSDPAAMAVRLSGVSGGPVMRTAWGTEQQALWSDAPSVVVADPDGIPVRLVHGVRLA